MNDLKLVEIFFVLLRTRYLQSLEQIFSILLTVICTKHISSDRLSESARTAHTYEPLRRIYALIDHRDQHDLSMYIFEFTAIR